MVGFKWTSGISPYIEHGRNQYSFHSTGETYHIKSHIAFTTYNVIYMIQCRLCNLRTIGETKRRLKDRFNELGDRRPVLNPTSNYIHTAVSEHFLSNNHSDTVCYSFLLKNFQEGK